MISFGSDNHSGIHPKILKAIERANLEHDFAYGDDSISILAKEKFHHLFGDVEVFFMFNGTGANVTALRSMTRSYNSILCAQTAHINVDECGAPEQQSGCKLISIPTPDGKLTPDLVKPYITGFGFCHQSQPKVISISQTTELGTVYSADEIRALADLAHSFGMYLHMDGARFANGVVATGGNAKAITVDAGVDVLSFGGTKNGLMVGEAVVFFNKTLSSDFIYFRKQSMQLYSKMRFIAAQFCEYLTDDLWINLANNSNNMARYLYDELSKVKGVNIVQPVEANAIFIILPNDKREIIREKYFFYDWDEQLGVVRLMCSFDTTKEQIDKFTTFVDNIING